MATHHDFIIIGAGSAGCVLANRLSADGASVLLVEAGPPDRSALIHIPGLFSTLYRQGRFAWEYRTVPQRHVDGRVMRDVRGKVLGGSSSTNGMLYCRGAAADYDGWAAMGNDGWSYADILPYYRRAEDHAEGADAFHGVGGPLKVQRSRMKHPLARAFVDAAVEAGHPYSADINGADRQGFGPADSTIAGGKRWSAAQAYLRPAVARSDLEILTGAQATRILMEGSRAIGVELALKGDRVRRMGGEVILAAGALQSPHLLMLSGIGPADHLRRAGVMPHIDLPGVGSNLHDHASVTVHAACSYRGTLAKLLNPVHAAGAFLRYMLHKDGVMGECSIEVSGMMRSPGAAVPDIKCQFVPIPLDPVSGLPIRSHGMINRMELTVPESRGTLRLASCDPFAAPLIDPNYLAEPADRAKLRFAIREAIEIFRQPAFAPFGVEPQLPVADMEDDDALDAYVRATLTNDHHAGGTCAMGSGPTAVVDARLRVHGLEGLRVVDASIMPRLVSGNTNAPVIMIAEKASDMILGREIATAT